jgi:hypothetical protein
MLLRLPMSNGTSDASWHPQNTQEAPALVGGPTYSVTIDDPTGEGVAVGSMQLQPGHLYVVRLVGFPPSLPLSLQLIGSQQVADPVTKVCTDTLPLFPNPHTIS